MVMPLKRIFQQPCLTFAQSRNSAARNSTQKFSRLCDAAQDVANRQDPLGRSMPSNARE
jgi:hypothetical protein